MMAVGYFSPPPTPIIAGIMGHWVLEVAPGWEQADQWTRVHGIMEFTPPQIEKEEADDSDFDSLWGSSFATGLSYSSAGKVKLPRGAVKDPGQAILEAAGMLAGEDGRIHFRCYDKFSDTAQQGIADCVFTEDGGSRTDLTTASFSLTGNGALQNVNHLVTAG